MESVFRIEEIRGDYKGDDEGDDKGDDKGDDIGDDSYDVEREEENIKHININIKTTPYMRASCDATRFRYFTLPLNSVSTYNSSRNLPILISLIISPLSLLSFV